MAFRAERDAALRAAQTIARTELVRQRRRLGELTPEQEMGVEDLIMSTVTKVMEVAGTVLNSLPLVHATDANRQQTDSPFVLSRSRSDASRHLFEELRFDSNDR